MTSFGIFAAEIDFSSGWERIYSSLESALGAEVLTFITGIGTLLVVAAIFKMIWDKRKGTGGGGKGGGMDGVTWAIVAGVALAAPGLFFRIILFFVDAIANAIAGLFPGG